MRIAVVTGSGRGIGNAIASTLEREGVTVVYSDLSEELPGVKNYVKCDISSAEDRKGLLEKVMAKFGRVDILVNNAGVSPKVRMNILDTTEESFDRLIRINLKSTFFMCQLFANQMIRQGGDGCKIINISSVSSYASSVERGEYCISKAGISMTTQLFAHRLAEYGISVFEVRPGIIKTDMTAPVTEKYEKLIAEGITPIKRFGLPQDVANCVLGLCSGLFDFSTGQIINADGGFHIRRF
ncbi:MAG: 3-ketoacyl-ACP reductase [Clostridiales bacterium]|nr:3-ketoacyl-ACP reductase [Clostridiales bacterium]